MKAFLLSLILVVSSFSLNDIVVPNSFAYGAIIQASEFNVNNDSIRIPYNLLLDSLDKEFIRFTDLTSGDSTLTRLQVDSIMQNTYMDSLVLGWSIIDSITGNPYIDSVALDYGAITTLAVSANTTIGGTLDVTGNATFNATTLFVNASNNQVGIGTTTPAGRLELSSTGAGDTEFFITDNLDSYNNRILIKHNDGSGGYFEMKDDLNVANVIIRSYGNSHFNGGNIGIGTTTPSEKLEVNGNILADTLKGAISQNYGLLYTATAKSVTYTTSFVKLDVFDAIGLNNNMTVEADSITALKTGIYRVSLTSSVTQNNDYQKDFEVRKNGSSIDASFVCELTGDAGAGGSIQTIAINSLVSLTANDYIDVYIKASGGHSSALERLVLTITELR